MSEERFDCAIVGAGPAGSIAAYELARQGLEVLLVEKGDPSGSKNMTGGRLYSHSLHKIIPNFWEEAPVQRRVEKEELSFLTASGAVTLSLHNEELGKEPNHSFVVLRADFDAWLTEKAEEEGAMVALGTKVDDLLWSGGKVCGIKCGEDEIYADVVILADGVNSLLAQKAGLKKELQPKQVAVGVKSVIQLSQKTIEERFGLKEGEGLARLMVGECTKGLAGGGFLYTNKESVSLGVVVNMHDLIRSGFSLPEIVEDLKRHPSILPLIEGGEVVEYSAHLIPEGGLEMMPTLYSDGVMVVGDAAGFVINTGYLVRGMDLAITSGAVAAQAVIVAKDKGDFSAQSLKTYEDLLKESHVYQGLTLFKNAPKLFEESMLFSTVPSLIVDIMTDLFKVDGNPPEKTSKKIIHHLRETQALWKLVKLGIKGAKSI